MISFQRLCALQITQHLRDSLRERDSVRCSRVTDSKSLINMQIVIISFIILLVLRPRVHAKLPKKQATRRELPRRIEVDRSFSSRVDLLMSQWENSVEIILNQPHR